MRIKRQRRYQAVEPDEILIDAANLPQYDRARLEGRIERPLAERAFFGFLLVASIVFATFGYQLVKLQVVDAAALKERAEANRLFETLIIAERGVLTDRHGTPIALNDPQEDVGYALRAYPLGEAAAHLIGYVSYPRKDANGFWYETGLRGVAGLEAFLDSTLGGVNGVEIKEVTAVGAVVSGSVMRRPAPGKGAALSIDAGVQHALFEALRERTHGGPFQAGSGIIMDVFSGEVIALASYPSFDPSVVALGAPHERIAEYLAHPRAPFLDRAISGLYTPGSVVKPFLALAALEERIITPEKKIYSAGSITIPNPYNPSLPSIFRDWRAHGWTDMREAIAVSSDVYFYAIGGGYEDQRGLGISNIERYLRMFGFGEISGIPLSGEEAGVIPNPEWKASVFDGERWFLGNTYHTAIGQYGFQTTPMQLVRATAALANGGTLVEPSVQKGVRGATKRLPFDDAHIQVINEGMRLAVTNGTGGALIVPGVSVAGKTGTAEVGARKEFINSLIIGFFPYENPKYAFVIVMERGAAGTTVGAPAAMRNVLEWIRDNRPEMVQ